MQFNNRVTRMTGAELPIVQAPMGWIARSQLASAVCNAGGAGNYRNVLWRTRCHSR